MSGYTFSISDTFSYAFSVFKRYPDILLTATMITVIMQVISIGMDFIIPQEMMLVGGVARLILALASVYVSVGIYKVCLKIYDDQVEDLSFAAIFRQGRYYVPVLIYTILYIFIITVLALPIGIVLVLAVAMEKFALFAALPFLFIPMCYVYLRLQFAQLLIIDRDMDPMRAISLSWKATKGHVIQLFLFAVVNILLMLAGVLAWGVRDIDVSLIVLVATISVLVVGYLVAFPVITVATISVYRQLIEFYEATQGDQAEQAF